MAIREDILGGLKNAAERGESIENAKSSFVNAGYSSEDVEEAAKALSAKPTLEKLNKKAPKPSESTAFLPLPVPSPKNSDSETKPLPKTVVKPKKKFGIIKKMAIGISVIMLIIVGISVFVLVTGK